MEEHNQISGSTRDEALYLISLGLPIIPICSSTHQGMNVNHCSKCTSPGKMPLLKNWQQWTTTTKEDIFSWFHQNPNINIGIPLGEISGLVGLDIDGREGEIILLAMSNGDIPDTWQFTTGSGRRLLYSLPKGIATKKMTMKGTEKHEGFEILCSGQQTICPTSTHSTGRKYQWVKNKSPREIQIAQAPQWILDQIKVDDSQPMVRASQPVTTDDWNRVLHEGERNVETARKAGSLIGRGLPKEQVLEFLKIHNINYCDPPLSNDEIEIIVASIYERERMQQSKKARTGGDDKSVFKATPFVRQFLFKQKELGYQWKYSTEMGAFFRCDETTGPWKLLDLDYTRSEIRKALINEEHNGHAKWDSVHFIVEAIEALKSELVLPGEVNLFDIGYSTITNSWQYPPLEIVSLRNGLFEWQTNILHPWTSKVYTSIQLPVDYEPTAKCPTWLSALNDWIPDEETIYFLQEFAGLCLIPDTSFRTAVILYGTGANGKSMFLDTIHSLFGNALVSIPLHRLTDRFETFYLQNKLVNICGDIDAKYIADTGVIKTIIGGDVNGLRGEIKHGKSFNFTPVCRLLFSANKIPTVSDKTIGWISRWKFIEFPHTFPVNPAYKIEHTIMFEKEKSGILNWAIEGLQRLKVSNKWTTSKAMMESEEEYRSENDNVSAFLSDYVKEVDYDSTQSTLIVANALHKCYNEWVDKFLSGTQPVALHEFSKRVHANGFKKGTRVIEGRSTIVFFGMKVNDNYQKDYNFWVDRMIKNIT